MTTNSLPSFADLRQHYASKTAPIARQGERARLITYLRDHGASVATADDVYHAILTLDHEEELSAFKCREGVAVGHASDGWWLLLRHDDSFSAPEGQPMGAEGC